MAEIKNINPNLQPLVDNQFRDAENINIPKNDKVGSEQAEKSTTQTKTAENVLTDVVVGREASQLESAQQLRDVAGVSAVEKFLGLDLQPTMQGVLVAPPGNSEALRHLSPTMRRNIMRKMLQKQRERMKKLAHLMRKFQDEEDLADGNSKNSNQESLEESFMAMLLAEKDSLTEEQYRKAAEELSKMAKMLDVLDEMLILQDYTISQMGAFAQG